MRVNALTVRTVCTVPRNARQIRARGPIATWVRGDGADGRGPLTTATVVNLRTGRAFRVSRAALASASAVPESAIVPPDPNNDGTLGVRMRRHTTRGLRPVIIGEAGHIQPVAPLFPDGLTSITSAEGSRVLIRVSTVDRDNYQAIGPRCTITWLTDRSGQRARRLADVRYPIPDMDWVGDLTFGIGANAIDRGFATLALAETPPAACPPGTPTRAPGATGA